MKVIFDRIGAYTEENRYYTYYGGKLFIRTVPEKITCDGVASFRDSVATTSAGILSDYDRISRMYPEHVNFVRDLKRWCNTFELYAMAVLAKRFEKHGLLDCSSYNSQWLDTVNLDFQKDQLNPLDIAEIVGSVVEARLSRAKRNNTESAVPKNDVAWRLQIASRLHGLARDFAFLYVAVMAPNERPKDILPYLWAMVDTMYKYGANPIARQALERNIGLLEERSPGADAYNFMLPDSSYNIRSLSDFRGKAVLIHFWGTWCGPCINELERVRDFEQKHANDSNLVCLNVALEDHRYGKWKKFLLEHQLAGIQLYAEGLWESDVAQKLGIIGVPFRLVIDDKGKILNSFSGTNYENTELEKAILDAERI
ncbi:MAG: TlpA disulfide reductase family protein [Bacteroidota bacterium]|nr:TlpA disulfide reductase family protein [Bacteroidota bacterium]MDP4231853.1 TlpA disulfide reductase family protein [Bacteroidota bacterium]MDP4242739.1 TlpA disulfide reductase family protein [Bacteroidota bacterium]MDP4287190.1 TlpA disulfide reductase family protein [Bacteroidota bacterium]